MGTAQVSAPNVPHASISVAGRVQLLEMTFKRLRYSALALPCVAALFVLAAHAWEHPLHALGLWALTCTALGAALLAVHRWVYVPDQAKLAAEQLLDRWTPRLHVVGWLFGLSVSLPTLIMGPEVRLELAIIWQITLAAIVASNATHQTPVLGVFWRFLASSWTLNLLFLALLGPKNWPVLVALGAAYSISMYRYGKTTHRFFVEQIRLREHSEALARDFQAAKESAESALQMKNQFLATASHDLRQPVHAMGMLVEAISRQNDNPRLTPLVNDLRSSIRSVGLMFNSLLDLSKMEAQDAKAQPTPVFLDDLVREVATVFRQQATSQGLRLRLHLPRQAALALTDAMLLRQALTNLVHNALRYTISGGVLLALRQRAGQWQLEVWDTGMGVADAQHEQIFSPYFRVDNAWNHNRAGYGLGLHVVARCAALLEVTYGLQSRLHRGTRFWLRLPPQASLAAPTGVLAMMTDQTAEHPLRPLNGRCLVVEDDPLLICAMQSLLEGWGIQTRFATCAAQAFAHLDAGFSPQAVLCDQRLRSGESGFEILCDLLDHCPHAGGAMMSGEFDSPVLRQAEAEGYVVLQKPLEVSQLHALLERWLPVPPMAQAA